MRNISFHGSDIDQSEYAMKQSSKLKIYRDFKYLSQFNAVSLTKAKCVVIPAIIIFVGVAFAQEKRGSRSEIELTPIQQATAFIKNQELKFAEELIEQFPDSEIPYVLMGNLHWQRMNGDKAVTFWEKALKLNPRRDDVYYKMAKAAFEKEDFEKAITLWRKVLEIAPKNFIVHNHIVDALIKLGKYKEALEELEVKVTIPPSALRSFYLLGQAYLQQKEYDKAMRYFQKVTILHPDHPKANYGLAMVYMRLKQRDKATEHMAIYKQWQDKRGASSKRTFDFSGDELAVYSQGLTTLCVNANNLYRAKGDFQGAEKLVTKGEQAFQEAINLNPKWFYLYRQLALLYLRTNAKLPQARAMAEKAVALDPNAENYFVLCQSCFRNSDFKSAMSMIEKAMELQPNNVKYKRVYDLIKRKQ